MDARTTWVALSLVHTLVDPREVLGRVARVEDLLEGEGRAWFALRWPAVELEKLLERAEGLLGRCAADGIQVWTHGDADYPAALRDIDSPPPALYALGDRGVLERPTVAMVGARHATGYGLRAARTLAGALSHAGICVVSGMALGIDAASHEGALGGPGGTAAVLASGPELATPKSHTRLHRRLVDEQLVLSEFAPGTTPRPDFFLRRNRVIAGLARGVVVVEAAARSGALTTARLAREAGRPVLAVPGPIDSAASRGANRLLRDGARPVLSAQDVMAALDLEVGEGERRPHPLPPTEGDEARVLEALHGAGAGLDELVERTGLAPGALRATLLRMRLHGAIEAGAGERYYRRNEALGDGA